MDPASAAAIAERTPRAFARVSSVLPGGDRIGNDPGADLDRRHAFA